MIPKIDIDPVNKQVAIIAAIVAAAVVVALSIRDLTLETPTDAGDLVAIFYVVAGLFGWIVLRKPARNNQQIERIRYASAGITIGAGVIGFIVFFIGALIAA